jgi:hypothetical protein
VCLRPAPLCCPPPGPRLGARRRPAGAIALCAVEAACKWPGPPLVGRWPNPVSSLTPLSPSRVPPHAGGGKHNPPPTHTLLPPTHTRAHTPPHTTSHTPLCRPPPHSPPSYTTQRYPRILPVCRLHTPLCRLLTHSPPSYTTPRYHTTPRYPPWPELHPGFPGDRFSSLGGTGGLHPRYTRTYTHAAHNTHVPYTRPHTPPPDWKSGPDALAARAERLGLPLVGRLGE